MEADTTSSSGSPSKIPNSCTFARNEENGAGDGAEKHTDPSLLHPSCSSTLECDSVSSSKEASRNIHKASQPNAQQRAETLANNLLKIEIPFPSEREARVVYNSLRVDKAPKRNTVKTEFIVEQENLIVNLSSPNLKNLRTSANGLMDLILLCMKTMERFDNFQSTQTAQSTTPTLGPAGDAS